LSTNAVPECDKCWDAVRKAAGSVAQWCWWRCHANRRVLCLNCPVPSSPSLVNWQRGGHACLKLSRRCPNVARCSPGLPMPGVVGRVCKCGVGGVVGCRAGVRGVLCRADARMPCGMLEGSEVGKRNAARTAAACVYNGQPQVPNRAPQFRRHLRL